MNVIYGVGFNDFNGRVTTNRKNDKEYSLWTSILERCYGEGTQEVKITYRGCTMSENFKSFSFFYNWCQSQKGFRTLEVNNRHWHLDKDILVRGNKLYSEHTCCFIPQKINALLTRRQSLRGEYPLGVSLNKRSGKFQASCKDGTGKLKYLGIFPTQEQAFEAYKAFKESIVKRLANEYKGLIDARVYHALMNYTVEISD